MDGGQNQPMDAMQEWHAWPHHNPIVQNIHQLELDLNVAPNQEEMIVDPLFPPAIEVVPEPILVQVNENKEDAAIEEEPEMMNNDIQGQEQNVLLPEVQVDILVLNEPVNVFLLEIQEEDLMNDEELQNQAALDGEDGGPQNLFIGAIQLLEELVHGLFEPLVKENSVMTFTDPTGLWGKFFAPNFGMTPTCFVSPEWASFFTTALLSPKLFKQTKEFLAFKGLTAALDGIPSVGFVLPLACPVKNPPACSLTELHNKEGKLGNQSRRMYKLTR